MRERIITDMAYEQVNPLIKSMANTYAQCLQVAVKKNADYGADEDPFRNFRRSEMVGIDPARGILIRLTDKLARIGNLLIKPPEVVGESLRDSLEDSINYCAIMIAYLEEEGRLS